MPKGRAVILEHVGRSGQAAIEIDDSATEERRRLHVNGVRSLAPEHPPGANRLDGVLERRVERILETQVMDAV